MPNVRVFEVPEAVKRKLLRYTPTTQPTWNRQNEFDQRPLPESSAQPELESDQEQTDDREQDIQPQISPEIWEKEHQAFTQLANLYQDPGCLDFTLKSIPIQPWAHQLKILRRVAQEFPPAT